MAVEIPTFEQLQDLIDSYSQPLFIPHINQAFGIPIGNLDLGMLQFLQGQLQPNSGGGGNGNSGSSGGFSIPEIGSPLSAFEDGATPPSLLKLIQRDLKRRGRQRLRIDAPTARQQNFLEDTFGIEFPEI